MYLPNNFRLVLLPLVLLALVTACVDQPQNELTLAREALDAVVSEGAEIYTPEDLGRITSRLDDAIAEIRHQDGLYFRNYSLAIFTLGQVVADAEALEGKLAQRKIGLKIEAETAWQDARAAISEIKLISGVTPLQREAGVPAVEAVKPDFTDLDIKLEQIQQEIAAGEFVRARQLALDLNDRVLAMDEVVRVARTGPAATSK